MVPLLLSTHALVQEYWPEFQAELASHGRFLPAYVTKEFDEYLKCGRLEHDFLRVRCEACHDEKLVAFSCKRRGFRLKRLLLVPQLWRKENGEQCCVAGG